jgi:glycosyltransferase involved in cell wall biosynthesis
VSGDSAKGRSPVRVLHLRDSPWVDGPGRTIIESGAHFDSSRVRYHIGALVPGDGSSHPMLEEAARRGLLAHAIIDRGGLDRRAVAAILDIVDKHDVQVLHTSDLRTRLLGSMVCRVRPRLVRVTTAHGWIANSFRRRVLRVLDKALLRLDDHVVFVSKATRALVPSWWLPDERVTVLHNALVLETYGAAGAHRDRRAPDAGAEIHILNVGRLSPEKGQDLMLRATASLMREFPGIRVHFAGIGPMEAELRSLAHDLGIESRVTFHGFVADMPSLYANSDLVVQSSLTEGLPNVILEAAYLRVPIIATDVGGTREVTGHGREAWLVPPGSVDDLIDGMRRYLMDPTEFAGMTQAAHEKILGEFSFPARTERMTALYEWLVALRQPRDPRQESAL